MGQSDSKLKRRSVTGLLWSMLDKGGQHVIIFASGIWLARLLSPDDYGMIGVLSIFTYLANALQESGFTAAIVRKERLSREDLDVVFYMNVGIGSSLYLILFAGAGYVADFYGTPELYGLSRVVFLMFLFNAFSVVQNALLLRDMNFKVCTVINTSAMILSYGAALVAAFKGAGTYAIALQISSFAFFRMSFLWFYGSWRPGLSFRKNSFRDLFSFSFKLLMTNILNTVACRLFPSVIGKCYGTMPAGFYENAQRWGNMPQDFVAGTVANVSFSAISEVQRNSEERMKAVFRKSVRVTAFFVFPLFVGIMVCAENFINYALTQKWLPSVPFIMFICVAGIFNGLNTANYNMLKTRGRSSDILRFEIFRNVFTIAGVVLCIPLGAMWMMAAMVLVAVVNYLIFSVKVDRMTGVSAGGHIADVAPYGFLAAAAGVAAWFAGMVFEGAHPLLQLAVQGIVMLLLYAGGGYLLGSAILSEAVQMLKRKRGED